MVDIARASRHREVEARIVRATGTQPPPKVAVEREGTCDINIARVVVAGDGVAIGERLAVLITRAIRIHRPLRRVVRRHALANRHGIGVVCRVVGRCAERPNTTRHRVARSG